MEKETVYDDISSIKNIMERSTRFISLSGISGVMAGVYALIGAWIASGLIPTRLTADTYPLDGSPVRGLFYGAANGGDTEATLFLLALAVLILSVGTGIILTVKKARRKGQRVWNQSSKALIKNGLVPLLTGGCFILILLLQHHYSLIAPACLVFYGLALVAASQYTYGDVKWLGISDVLLGLIALLIPAFGLLFWAIGFGVLHILYGTVMYFKYDRENSAD